MTTPTYAGGEGVTDMIKIRNCKALPDFDLALQIIRDYIQWLDMDLCFQDIDNELSGFSTIYSPPGGAFLIAYHGDAPAGGGGVRRLEPGVCEMKRLFVYERFRGWGVGRALCTALIREAKELGYDKMRLDTLGRMKTAARLYEGLGFKEIEPYRFNPDPGVKYMELEL